VTGVESSGWTFFNNSGRDAVAAIAPELKAALAAHARMELTFENSSLVAEHHRSTSLSDSGRLQGAPPPGPSVAKQ
jgi:hypothetical protein